MKYRCAVRSEIRPGGGQYLTDLTRNSVVRFILSRKVCSDAYDFSVTCSYSSGRATFDHDLHTHAILSNCALQKSTTNRLLSRQSSSKGSRLIARNAKTSKRISVGTSAAGDVCVRGSWTEPNVQMVLLRRAVGCIIIILID